MGMRTSIWTSCLRERHVIEAKLFVCVQVASAPCTSTKTLVLDRATISGNESTLCSGCDCNLQSVSVAANLASTDE